MGWGSRVLTHTEEMRKMPFKPHWASLGHGHLMCVWPVQPGTKWATRKKHGYLIKPELELSSRGFGYYPVWRGRKSMQAQRHSACLHTPAELGLEFPGT